MSPRRRLVGVAVVATLVASCGARTTLREAAGDGAGGGDPTTTSGAGGGGSGAVGAGGAGGGATCVPESFGGPATAGAQRIAVDDEHAYWTQASGLAIERARFGGGTPEVIAEHDAGLGDIALDGDRLLVAASPGDLLAVPTSGGPLELVEAGVGSVVSIAVDDDAIYWMTGGDGVLAYAIERLGRDGARSVLLAPIDFGRSVALVGDDLVFTATAVPGVDELGLVARMPRTGGPVTILASSRPDPTNVFAVGEDLYWTEQFDALGGPVGVARLRPGDAAPELVLVAPDGSLPILSAATARSIVMTALDVERGALLLAAPIDGGPTEVVAEGPDLFLEPATTADRVAWTVTVDPGDRDASTDVAVRVLCR